jgi:hypothetical protein
MSTTPTRYRATDYPAKYRPLGYWRSTRRAAAAESAVGPPRWKRRFWLLVALMVATLVLHIGIAAAYLGGSSDTTAQSALPTVTTDPNAACEPQGAGGTLDPDLVELDPSATAADGAGAANSGNPQPLGANRRSAL